MAVGKLQNQKYLLTTPRGSACLRCGQNQEGSRQRWAGNGYCRLFAAHERAQYYRQQRAEISDISRSLKALAKELKVPVIALSQLNRRVEDRSDKRPQLADLRESAPLNRMQMLSFLYTAMKYITLDTEYKGTADIIIGKQRNGPTGDVRLTFIDKYTRFERYTYEKVTYNEIIFIQSTFLTAAAC